MVVAFTSVYLPSTLSRASIPILFCLPQNDNASSPSSPLPPNPNNKPKPRPMNTQKPPLRSRKRKPSVAEIERAIGAGKFRDRDTSDRGEGMYETFFDAIFSNSIGRTEGNVEKKLRETGEWLVNSAERPSPSRSPGKSILKALFQWIIPMWILGFLVAAGIIKLPFSSPFIDDLIM